MQKRNSFRAGKSEATAAACPTPHFSKWTSEELHGRKGLDECLIFHLFPNYCKHCSFGIVG